MRLGGLSEEFDPQLPMKIVDELLIVLLWKLFLLTWFKLSIMNIIYLRNYNIKILLNQM